MELEEMILREVKTLSKTNKTVKKTPRLSMADSLVNDGMMFVGVNIHLKKKDTLVVNSDMLTHTTVKIDGNRQRFTNLHSCIAYSFNHKVAPDSASPVVKAMGPKERCPFPQWLGDVQAVVSRKYKVLMPMSCLSPVKPTKEIYESSFPEEMRNTPNLIYPMLFVQERIRYDQSGMSRVLRNIPCKSEKDRIVTTTDHIQSVYKLNYFFVNADRLTAVPHSHVNPRVPHRSGFLNPTVFMARSTGPNTTYNQPVIEISSGFTDVIKRHFEHHIEFNTTAVSKSMEMIMKSAKTTVKQYDENNALSFSTGADKEVSALSMDSFMYNIHERNQVVPKLQGSIRPEMFTPARVAQFMPGMSIPIESIINAVKNMEYKYNPIYTMSKYNMNDIISFSTAVMEPQLPKTIDNIKYASDTIEAGVHQMLFALYPRHAKKIIVAAEVGIGKTRTVFTRWLYLGKPRMVYITTPRLVNEILYDKMVNKIVGPDIIFAKQDLMSAIRRWKHSKQGKTRQGSCTK